MTETAEARYTLDDAARELARRECAEVGHQPWIEMRDYDQRVGAWLCRCNVVTWVAQDGSGEPT